MRVFLLVFLVFTASVRLPAVEQAQDMRSLCSSAGDYTFMWWAYGLRDPRKVVDIQTSRYALQFGVPAMKLTHTWRPRRTPQPKAPRCSREATLSLASQTHLCSAP